MNKKTKDFKFDKRAVLYDEGFEGKLSKRFYELLRNQIVVSQGAVVLDVGCGTGTILKNLDKFTNISGYGIDVEENMINVAKQKCKKMNFIVSNCTETPFEDSKFDIITSCMAYHHFADKKGFAREVSRITKHGGHLYIADPRFPWLIRKPLNLALRFHKVAGYFGTPEEIKKVFCDYGFELIEYKFDRYAQCIKLQKVSPSCHNAD